MGTLLFIPWFKLEPIEIPLLWLAGAVLLGSAVAAAKKEWRQQATSMALFVGGASIVAFKLNIDPVPIQPFGILVATGVILGTRLAERYAKSLNIDPYEIADFATHVVFTGFVFAMLLNAIFYETDKFLAFLRDPSTLSWMGLSSYGGFIGAMVGILIWRWRRKKPAWPLSDAVAFAFPLGWMFGRTGCFVVHDHPGVVTDFFLAVDNYYERGEPRHDLGLYEIVYAALIMGVFLGIRHRWPVTREEDNTVKGGRPMGIFVALMPLLYTPGRFYLDTLRATDLSSADVRYWGFTPAQYASMGMLIMSLGLLYYVLKNPAWNVPESMRLNKAAAEAEKGEAAEDTGDKAAPSSAKRRKKKKKK